MHHKFLIALFISCLACAGMSSCGGMKKEPHSGEAIIISHYETEVLRHPQWSRNATLYTVNVRQHTAAGTFDQLERDLDRLKEMGVDIICLTPIFSVGQKLRTGKAGDPQLVRDFRGVDPSLGTLDEFKHLLAAAHQLKMEVILNWVSDFTSIDNPWTRCCPSFFIPDSSGTFLSPPGRDTTDAYVLNWKSQELVDSVKAAMHWWVKDAGVDGFFCLRSKNVPTAAWEEIRLALDSIRPVLMICDDERRELHLKAFDASQVMWFHQLSSDLAEKRANLAALDSLMLREDTLFPRSAYRVFCTSGFELQHEEGTASERYGALADVMDVLAFTLPGMPCLYSGQEGGEVRPNGDAHRLRMYDKDTVQWNNYPKQDFYSRLFKAHQSYPALWNGEFGGSFERIKTSSDDLIYAFRRKKGESEALVILNFSDKPQKIDFIQPIEGEFHSIFNNQQLSIFTRGDVKLAPHGYQVFLK